MKKRNFLRLGCLLLVLTLTAGLLPAAVRADASRTVGAIPYSLELSGERQELDSSFVPAETYAPDEIVDVIVELAELPLLSVFSTGEIETQSAQVANAQQRLLDTQSAVLLRMDRLTGGKAELQWQYTTILNGFAVRIPYGELETIRGLAGVKDAFVAGINELVEPAMDNALDLGHVLPGRDLGYTGAGITIAIIDTGLDTDHEAFTHSPAGASLGVAEIAAAMERWDLTCEAELPGLTAQDTYVSEKVPFAFDYADRDTDVNPDTAPDANNVSHGTHVAGIAAGYAENAEGQVRFSGVAPDAQLLILKAFPDSGAGTPDTVTLAALEDAVKLGADVVNMSLGTDCGFSDSRDRVINEAYRRVREAGVSLICAAGNQYDSALRNNTGTNMSLTSDPDTGVVSSPASFGTALSVASADNLIATLPAIRAGERYITYTNTQPDIQTIPGNYTYVVVEGVGSPADYAAAGDLRGRIALVRRGELTFKEKVLNGQAAGAAAVIVCDNTDGLLSNMSVEGAAIPAIFISKADGDYLMELADKRITVFAADQSMDNPTAGQISEFSSMGVTPDLKLKPEITAPGGYIYSALPESLGGYGSMSGTSMATPFLAGTAALVHQELVVRYPDLAGPELQDLVDALLMSTARPITDRRTGNFYTPRLQGNGLVDAAAALTTPVVLHTDDLDGSVKPILNLGDDVARTGVYELSFRATNLSDTDRTYTLSITAMAPAVEVKNGISFLSNKTVKLDAALTDTVTIPAGETVTITRTLTLSEADKTYLTENFENGIYVEGFIELLSDEVPSLTAAYLGFFGDWTEAPIIDYGDWYKEQETALSFMNQAAGYVPYFYGYALLGQNAFVAEQNYIPENFAISPNGDDYFDAVELQVGLLRGAKQVRYTVTDEDGNVHYEYVSDYNRKTVYSPVYDMMVPASAYAGFAPTPYGGTDANGRVLPDGTRLTYTIQAELDFDEHESHNRKDTWSFPLLIDTAAPELKNMTVRFTRENGRTYLEGTFADGYAMMDVAAMGVLIYGNSIYGDVNSRQDQGSDGTSKHDFRFDVTDLDSEYIYLMGYDSAYNCATYLIPTEQSDELTITQEAILLSIGESAQVAVIDHSGSGEPLTWVSGNEAVAAVNENGVITARAGGCTMVTASRGGESISCLVGVRPETKVESFRLNVSEITLPLNSAAQLEIVDILPEGIHRYADQAVWTTSDPEVTGMYGQYFYADKVGTATITATMDGVSASCQVTVVPNDPDRQMYLCNELGGEYPAMQSNYITDYQILLTARFRNDAGQTFALDEDLIWTTSDPNILRISGGESQSDGSILGQRIALEHVGPGVGVITATTLDGSASRTYTVNVYPNQPLYLNLPTGTTTMLPGETMKIYYSLDSEGSRPEDSRVFFRSLNEDVVTVEDGYLTAVRPGWAMVMGTLTSGYDAFMVVHVEEVEHSWVATVTEPNCTTGGFTTYTCEYCGESYVSDETEALGHAWEGLVCTRCDVVRENPFTDVCAGDFYFEPVLWALEKGITTGVSATRFGPNADCQRAAVVTFLWRAAGEPMPQSMENPFVDVEESDFFFHAVLWAVETGITNGMDSTHFGPYEACNRAQVVTFLWRAQGEPAIGSAQNPFTDVAQGSFYETAVLWAVDHGITNGLDSVTFGPGRVCNRAQIVTFLYRAFA